MTPSTETAEHRRLRDPAWKRWGPYLAERAWGTVREDYSADGDAWNHFSHDDARRRAYRWNEDGLGGFSDHHQRLCLAVALWNGVDPILKERLFGLTNPEGNHGEDVKEIYFYTDATPTASYAEMRYLYPATAFPYQLLIDENGQRGRQQPEFEIEDTGVFDDGFFDVLIRYAKADPEVLVLEVEVTNRTRQRRRLLVLPTLWFRNTWSWFPDEDAPSMRRTNSGVEATWDDNAMIWATPHADKVVFCDNETAASESPYPKDSFHRLFVDGDTDSVNPAGRGTKAAAIHHLDLAAGASASVVTILRPRDANPVTDPSAVVSQRRVEADEFYGSLPRLDPSHHRVRRQAYAGLVWTKQFYAYDVGRWLVGDPAGLSPPPGRGAIRNGEWDHLRAHDVISMPDAWEYPWFATWDLAFQCVPFADIDPDFAKQNLSLVTTDRYLHPNGQLPAYEWEFGNVNPPVMAWAARKVFEEDLAWRDEADRQWLANLFYLLSLNYTWWQNRKDTDGNNVFQGGFLGLDNISLFDRSAPLPTGGHIDQSDGTAWMGFFSLGMLRIALLLAQDEPRFEQLAMRYFRHFGEITEALNEWDHCLWAPDDGFFYDVLHLPDGSVRQLGVKSLVGLLPLIAVEVIPEDEIQRLPDFSSLLRRYEEDHPATTRRCTSSREGRLLVSAIDEAQLLSILAIMCDPDEFLSPFGIRSLSRAHSEPYVVEAGGHRVAIAYEPGESSTGLFGGNSNWRGPIWFPLNYLIVEALREYHSFYGPEFTIEYPTGSGVQRNLDEVADDLSARLCSLFVAPDGAPSIGPRLAALAGADVLFHEYFDAETGRGLGAAHQTGWTALVAKLMQ